MTARHVLSSLLLLASFVRVQAQSDAASYQLGNGTLPISNSTYDYIVVGGGASGLVVYERLAETGKSVLLLERGGPSLYSSGGNVPTPWNDTLTIFDVPALFYSIPTWPGVNASCTDVPAGAQAGCILGGGTVLNGMQCVRPPTFDFDDKWPVSWRWADVKDSAARLYERIPGTTTPSTDGKHYDNDVWDVTSRFFMSGGYSQVDSNEEPEKKHKIYSYPALNIDEGFCDSPVRAYLPLAMRLPNFKLQMHTKVIRTIRTKSTIIGVEVEDAAGQRSIINNNPGGKVILAAGTMSSPRILFNSGIGPIQIKIVESGSTKVALPPRKDWITNDAVGLIRDHAIVTITFNVPGGTNVLSQAELINPSQEVIDLYAHGSGPLAQSWNRLMSYSTVTNDDGHETFIQTHAIGRVNDTVQFLVAITHNSTSTGVLGITPEDNTKWTKNPYLQSDSDREAMTKAIDELLAISRLPNSTLTCSGPSNLTGASILEAALNGNSSGLRMIPGSHMVGTTIMGTDDGTKNGSSVVDVNCKVYGTGMHISHRLVRFADTIANNLFVVDAGMHADLPTGNTQAIVMVAVEHAAQRIIALGSAANSTA